MPLHSTLYCAVGCTLRSTELPLSLALSYSLSPSVPRFSSPFPSFHLSLALSLLLPLSPPQPAPQAVPGRLRFAGRIGAPAPAAWREGRDYARAGRVRAGDLVLVTRSDGTLRFGEVLAPAGGGSGRGPAYEVCVAADGAGRPDKVRVEYGLNIFRPAPAAAAAIAGPARPAGAGGGGMWEQLEAAIEAAIRVSIRVSSAQ